MSRVEKAMRKWWGPPCRGDFEPECAACRAWAEFDALLAAVAAARAWAEKYDKPNWRPSGAEGKAIIRAVRALDTLEETR